mgnify:CR=1 FL=1
MEKISLQKKSFFNSIGLDVNNIPSELKLKAGNMHASLPKQDLEFLNTDSLTKPEQKHFRLKNLVGTDNLSYNGKTWLEIFVNNEKSDETIKQYFKNPNYYFKDLRKLDQTDLNHNNTIELYEDNGKYYVKDGVSRLSLMMTKYLLEMSRATTKEERALINKQYIFAANVRSIPKDRDIIHLTSMLKNICGTKLKIEKMGSEEECKYKLTYGEKTIELKSKTDLENFIKNNYLPKEYKSVDKLKNKVDGLAQISFDYQTDEEKEEAFLVIGKIFPNYEIFIKYYKKMKELNIENKLYENINLSEVTYEHILKKLINVVKQEENLVKSDKSKKTESKDTKEIISKKSEKDNLPEKEKTIKVIEKKATETKEKKEIKKEPTSKDDIENIRKKINEQTSAITNTIEMLYYKFKAEESNAFELANISKITLNIDRIDDDNINSNINSIKSHCAEIKNSINSEEDISKLKKEHDYIKNIKNTSLDEKIITAYKDEMNHIYCSCLNKHIQKLITDSKLQKLELQRAEIESEKCSFFSKLIGKAKLKQAKLDNINLKKQLILSESQFADKLHYYVEDGLSDLYAYSKNEEDERCLVEIKTFTRQIESNNQIQSLIDNNKLNRQIKEKIEQKRNLPQLALSKEKRRLFSKAQINLMEEKNNELKRVIQITRANSLKQQNTGIIPILGNIKTTKAVNKFCNDLAKMDGALRSLI